MIECLACGHRNEDNEKICAACGTQLYSMAFIDPHATETLTLDRIEVQHMDQPEPVKGSAIFRHGMVLNIHVHDDDRIIRIRPNEAILFGRKDPRLRLTPEVDLTDYEGAPKGVSRVHAALRVMDDRIVLVDMRSANGTFHNGERAVPGHPRLLRNGDQIQLGELVLTINFSE
jgi:hypothetical protein